MFCFQCEQTAGCTGCTGRAGVCGKEAEIAALQDQLTGELIGLARASDGHTLTPRIHQVMIEGLFTTVTNVNFCQETILAQIEAVRAAKQLLVPDCSACANPCGHNDAYDMNRLWTAQEDIRSLKSLILFGLRGMAAYAYHALILGRSSEEVNRFFYEGLFAVGEELTAEQLLPLVWKVGQVNLTCMALLDEANRAAYGAPEPVTVPLTVEKGPFIVITGHDLRDLELLLQQTEGKGIQIYTNGEMLPAHAYPGLKRYAHLKGNFGTAWHNQQRELDGIPAPIVYTTNCLMPPKDSYRDRVFTTGPVSYPGAISIGPDKDFTPVIEKSLELGGYRQDMPFTGINGGSVVTTGFGRETVLAAADTLVQAIQAGQLRHIFLVGGCDGARAGRSYYTEFVKATPADTAVLTLACGKYRFNDLDLGSIGGLPRILDMGQCNDAYSAIQVAGALAEALHCSLNELPLTLVLSWYEQKAVCILLTLLHLGMKNIYLGPTLPAFLSPKVAQFLIDTYQIHPTTTPEADLAQILGAHTAL